MSRRFVLAFVLLALLSGALPFAASARLGAPSDVQSVSGTKVTVRAGHTLITPTRRLAPLSARALSGQPLAATANIEVAYTGFSPAAQAAFDAAVAVWESIIVSPKVIHVSAAWTPLGEGVLGSAGPTNLYRLPSGDRWYPAALYEAICNCEGPSVTEIEADFNSAFGHWYLGTDGNAPADKYDFYSVVLHELGHGLGFISSFRMSGSSGVWGYSSGGTTYPFAFDVSEWSDAIDGNLLTNTSAYPNPSTALKTQLTDGSVYLGGANLLAANGGNRAPLFAPNPWQAGSSNSHFDETAYPPGSPNALMTPYLANGEVNHDPGPLTLALFRDIGWSLAGSATAPDQPTGVTASGGDAQALVSWVAPADDGGSPITGYTVTSSPDGKTCVANGATFSCTVSELTNGTPYSFTVTAMNVVGTSTPSDPSNSVTPQAPAGPANDSFASPETISGLSGTASGSNVNATGESGEPTNTATSAPIESIWYAWTAPATGQATVDLCGSDFDTTLGVYTGSAVGLLALVATDDDGGCGLTSLVTFTASVGTTYRISVDGYTDEQGATALAYSIATTDTTPPTVQAPSRALFAPGAVGTTVLLRVSWPAATDPSGIAAYELQKKKGTGAWVSVALPAPTATTVDVAVKPGSNYAFRLRARDGANNTGPWITTNSAKTARVQETPSAELIYVGAFKRSSLAGSSGGYVRRAGVAGRTAKLTFTGSSVAFVSTLAKGRGMAEVRIDGGAWVTIDLYAATTQTKRIVWAASVAPGTHTIEVRVKGTKNAAATGTRVDIDAFLVQP